MKGGSSSSCDLSSLFLIRAGIIVGSGGLIFGYDIGVISGTLPQLRDHFSLNDYETGLVVSILYAGSVIGSLFGGPLCDYIGRWRTIQLQNIIFIAGALCTGLATHLPLLVMGRFLVGIASAISGLADVPYLTEIAPLQYRGILAGQYEILVGAGILLSFLLDLLFVSWPNGWRVAFLLPGGLALLQSLCMFWLPESPKWLMQQQLWEDAKHALTAIYGELLIAKAVEESVSSRDDSQSADTHNEYYHHATTALPHVDDTLHRLPEHSVHEAREPTSGESMSQSNVPSSLLPDDVNEYLTAWKQRRQQRDAMRKSSSMTAATCSSRRHGFAQSISVDSPLRPSGSSPLHSHSHSHSTSAVDGNGSNDIPEDEEDSDEHKYHAHHPLSSPTATTSAALSMFPFSSSPTAALNSANHNGSRGSNNNKARWLSSITHFFLSDYELLRSYSFVIALVILLHVCSQITGCNVIRNYAPTLYEQAGVSTQAALTFNVLLGVVKLVFTIVSVLYVEHQGRRTFLLTGIVLVTAGMGFLCVMGFVHTSSSSSSTSSGMGNINDPIAFTLGCALVYAGFGIGYGPAPWILSSEMFPTAVRARIMSLCLLANNLAQLLMNAVFLPMTRTLTTSGSFAFFAVLNIVTFAIVYLFLVETRGSLPMDILSRSLQRKEDVMHRLCSGGSRTGARVDGSQALTAHIGSLHKGTAIFGDRRFVLVSDGQEHEETTRTGRKIEEIHLIDAADGDGGSDEDVEVSLGQGSVRHTSTR